MTNECPICNKFHKEGWIVENLEDEERTDNFPEEFNQLIQIENINNDHKILQCPKCGLNYEYTKSFPGGSYDFMRRWVVERLIPVIKNGKHKKKNLPQKETYSDNRNTSEYICPKCHSTDVICENAGIIGGEVFISLKCNNCGHDDILDEYQIISWRIP